MLENFFMTVRLALGVLGILWLLGGLYGVVVTAGEHEWGVMISAGLGALLGFLLAYAAFVETPWERHARRHDRAT